MKAPTVLWQLLEQVESGALSARAALDQLGTTGVAELGFARLDLDRRERQGLPEVVLGESKTVDQLVAICARLVEAGQNVLCTRVDEGKAASVILERPGARYDRTSRTLVELLGPIERRSVRSVAIVTAGTGDIPVAEEAAVTLDMAGVGVERVYDVGVAGIHRLFAELPRIRAASAVIAVAGMEGALPSVVGGLVSVPVVAVPTSVGYGAALGGLAALAGMLNSCAAGVVVVNIDNGFGAAMATLRHVLAEES